MNRQMGRIKFSDKTSQYEPKSSENRVINGRMDVKNVKKSKGGIMRNPARFRRQDENELGTRKDCIDASRSQNKNVI